jgi:hypothetical protein
MLNTMQIDFDEAVPYTNTEDPYRSSFHRVGDNSHALHYKSDIHCLRPSGNLMFHTCYNNNKTPVFVPLYLCVASDTE